MLRLNESGQAFWRDEMYFKIVGCGKLVVENMFNYLVIHGYTKVLGYDLDGLQETHPLIRDLINAPDLGATTRLMKWRFYPISDKGHIYKWKNPSTISMRVLNLNTT